ncbi:LysM peptidoglycan-binding domain-containing protein [Actinomadura macra]|uniref:LysM peptidoglycan-binding domain-containing protein n=1 Tax=Actinomadura macra TaxID=46164 RepID=UPI00082F3148|nr:LysM peptidoglycan-binding domain-containing protein [Actinomadura macra]
MPPSPESRYAGLPILTVTAPDGTQRRVVALRLTRPRPATTGRHRVVQGEDLDLLAHRFYGGEGLWWRILDANPLVFPLDVAAGDVLDLPEPGPATRTTRARGF